MSSYIEPIIVACLIFPLIAALFSIPYIIIQYRKYGSIPVIRFLIVYSFILYLLCAYFLIILPLPKMEDVINLTGPSYQLIPFNFISDFIKESSFILTDPNTYLSALKEPCIYQILYNILLFVPFGLYLHYYFKLSFKKTLLFSFLLSLFFELTQLTGLYGIYPRSYRLFDVDDLMINVIGGMVGYFSAYIALKILPNRDKIDEIAYLKGKTITGFRRIVCLFIDLFIFLILISILQSFNLKLFDIFIVQIIIYFVIIPIIFKGQTIGKKILNMKLVNLNEEQLKWYQYLIRYVLLYFIVIPLPFYITYLLSIILNGHIYLLFILTFNIMIAYYFIIFFKIIKKQILWYEKISKTKNISIIKIKDV